MVMLYRSGFTGGFEVVHGPKEALHETFGEGVTVIVGVGLGEVVSVAPEAVVASLTGVPVVGPPVVELAVGDAVTEGATEVMGAGVVLEALTALDVGFFARDVGGFVRARGGEFNSTTFRFALSTLDKRFISTSAKVPSLL